MLTDSEKLLNFRKKYKLTQMALAKKLGVKQQLIAMIENNSRSASATFKLAFLKTYGIDWDTQAATPDTFKYEQLENKCMPDTNIIPIPFYDVRVSAGTGQPTSEYEEKDLMYFDKRWVRNVLGANPDNLSIVKVSGDSMDGGTHPIKDGDLIMVDHSIKEGNNKVFAFKENNELYVKKLCWNFDGSLTIISYNPSPQYKTRTLSAESSECTSLEIIGKVIWNGSRESV